MRDVEKEVLEEGRKAFSSTQVKHTILLFVLLLCTGMIQVYCIFPVGNAYYGRAMRTAVDAVDYCLALANVLLTTMYFCYFYFGCYYFSICRT